MNKRGHLDERATDAHVSLVVQIRLPSFPEVRVIVKHFVGRDARRGRTPFTPSSNNPVHSSVHDNLLRVRGSHCSITGDFGNLSPQSGAHIEGRLREMWCDPRVPCHTARVLHRTRMPSTPGSMSCLREQMLGGFFCLIRLDQLFVMCYRWVEPFMVKPC